MPIGIDVGRDRTRAALMRSVRGRLELVAVASHQNKVGETSAIRAVMHELGTSERRCVLAVGAPEAILATTQLPPLSAGEQERAARFEVSSKLSYPIEDATIRVVRLDSGRCVVGAVRHDLLTERIAVAERAGLRPIAVDDTALALLRAYPDAPAVLDIGTSASVLIVRHEPLPIVRTFLGGGGALTLAIAEGLGIDHQAAETRKRTIGLCGAGQSARDADITRLANELLRIRATTSVTVRALTLTGNGSRLPCLTDAIERALGIPVQLGDFGADIACALPRDVVRAASPDWAVAYGLARWTQAA